MQKIRASRLARVGSAAAVAVLATGSVLASATVASAAKTPHARLAATTLTIKNKVISHNHHKADAISGLLRSHHKGVAGETVSLESRSGKKPRFVVVGTSTTAADGTVSFTVAPAVKTQFKLVFAGDSAFRKSHSNTITLVVGHRGKK